MDPAIVRHFLAQPPRATAAEVMRDAVLLQEPGAKALLEMVLALRVNRRTRRRFNDVVKVFPKADPPRWYGVLLQHLWSMYRLCICHCPLATHVFGF